MDSVVVFFVRQFVGAAFRTMNERELYTFEGIFPKPILATVLAMDVNHGLDVADTFARQDVNLLLRLGLTPMAYQPAFQEATRHTPLARADLLNDTLLGFYFTPLEAFLERGGLSFLWCYEIFAHVFVSSSPLPTLGP